MSQSKTLSQTIILQLITIVVILNGLLVMASTLVIQLHPHRFSFRSDDVLVSLPLVSGLSLVYLGTLLQRRKKAAWFITLALYTIFVSFNVTQFFRYDLDPRPWMLFRNICLPLLMVVALLYFRKAFTVKSAVQSLAVSIQTIVLIFVVTLAYGVIGYVVLDQHDFHQEIGVTEAVHRTVDQFDFTTDHSLVTYTRRARVFIDTLNILSAFAVGYAVISLFGPLRAKFSSDEAQREVVLSLLRHYSDDSDDFFKLWPHDKGYFLDSEHNHHAALAYRTQQGVALVVGDPLGSTQSRRKLVGDFSYQCRLNDWLPAFIHIQARDRDLYEDLGFQLQKIGEEAVVSVDKFIETTMKNKYFRQIQNKFHKNNYAWEVLQPPHSEETLAQLSFVSEAWLKLPGRQERGFMMGHFSSPYMQQCNVLVARDEGGAIQGFINQVTSFQAEEANFDLLRQLPTALGNTNDYMLSAFIHYAKEQGYKRVNLGLCPLAGLDKTSEDRTIVDSALQFVYANGNRFYSFSGLERFKAKYEPNWSDRYIAYKGGLRGFTRSVYALNKAMNRLK